MKKEKKEAVITFNYENITPENFIDLKNGIDYLLNRVFGPEVEDTFEIKFDADDNFEELLDAYIESLEEVDEMCDDHECEFNFGGMCLKGEDINEEPIETDNENCQCPLCQNEKLKEALDDLTGDYMELHKILGEKDEEIKYLIEQLTSSVSTSEYLAGKIRPNKSDLNEFLQENEFIKVLSKLMGEARINLSLK